VKPPRPFSARDTDEEANMEIGMKARICLSSALCLLFSAATATAQDFPVRPIRVVVAFPAGAPTDTIARIVAERLRESWGQPVVVENRGGAGGTIAAQHIARAPADGYHLLMISSAFAVSATLYKDPGYDSAKDLVPVVQIAATPNSIFVHPSVPAKTLKDVIALARKHPMSFSSSGTGTTPHLTGYAVFRMLGKTDMVHVPHTPATAPTAVAGGHVPAGVSAMPLTIPLHKAGKLRVLAVTSAKRSSLLPDVPTAIESGFEGIDHYTWFALFAPAGVPAAVIDRISTEVNRITRLPDVRERFATLGVEATPNTPHEFAEYVRSEIVRWGRLVKAAGAQPD
jgi:tripartite-type tricarboxylate transporter receptor subunit TctC